jgi:hypothetical protein
MRHASSCFTLEVYTQARARAKRNAQQRIVEMMQPEEGLAPDIRLERGGRMNQWVMVIEAERENRSSTLNGVIWCTENTTRGAKLLI